MSNTTTKFRSLMKGMGFGFVDLVIGIFLGLVLSPYIVKTLGDRLYAINVVISSFVGCFSILDLGTKLAVSRYFTEHFSRGEKKECLVLANSSFFLLWGVGIIAFEFIVLCGWGIYVLYPDMENRLLFFEVICINALAFGISFPQGALTGVIDGTLRQDLTSSRNVMFRLCAAVLSFVVLYCGGGLIGLSLVNLVVPILNTIALHRLVYVVFPEFTISRALVKISLFPRLISYGFSSSMNFISGVVSTRGGLFVLAAMLSLETVTPYSLVSVNLTAYFLAVMSLIGGNWLVNWLTHLIALCDYQSLRKSIRLATKVCIFCATFIMFGIIFWSTDFVTRWVGEKYLIAYPSLIVLALAIWVPGCLAPHSKMLFAFGKHRFSAYVDIIGVTCNIIMTIAFVYIGFGITGVALSTLIVNICVRGMIVPTYSSQLLGESPVKLLIDTFRSILISVVACFLPFIITQSLSGPNYPRLFLVGFTSILVYIPAVFLFGFKKDERAEIIQFLQKTKRRSRYTAKRE
ncbi:MAG: hypothetical protein ACRC2T_14065 [Thermoguttaceae bacterium]